MEEAPHGDPWALELPSSVVVAMDEANVATWEEAQADLALRTARGLTEYDAAASRFLVALAASEGRREVEGARLRAAAAELSAGGGAALGAALGLLGKEPAALSFEGARPAVVRALARSGWPLLDTHDLGLADAIAGTAAAGGEAARQRLVDDRVRTLDLSTATSAWEAEITRMVDAGQFPAAEVEAAVAAHRRAQETSWERRHALAMAILDATPPDGRLELLVSTGFTDYAGITCHGEPCARRATGQRREEGGRARRPRGPR